MDRKVLLTADSTCDLSEELKKRYKVTTYPLHIVLNDKSYDDSVNITPAEIYDNFYKTGTLPKTAAINTSEYIDFFKPYIDDGYDIVHINIGSALSSSHQSCLNAAQELGHIYPVDSCNLSSGTGLIVIEAALRIAKGMSAQETAEEVQALTDKSFASFILDKLDFMRAGGRCSTIAMLGANMLSLKPCIEVNNKAFGAMGVGKKYRGKLAKVLDSYVEERLAAYSNIRRDRIFITHSGISKELENLVYDKLKSKNYFDEILITRASCTISSHCGPNTLGILFMTE
ncbi:MAG: DegV family protein [Acutalibacteraceae bacterium]